MMGTSNSDNQEPSYTKKNTIQILKVRHLIRKNGYLAQINEELPHTDVEKAVNLNEDILNLEEIAFQNISKYIRYREEEEEITLKIAYVTEQEWLEAGAVENKSIAELQIKIFEYINNLPKEIHEVMEDIYKNTVKNKRKEMYVKFYYELLELAQSQDELSDYADDDDDDNSDNRDY